MYYEIYENATVANGTISLPVHSRSSSATGTTQLRRPYSASIFVFDSAADERSLGYNKKLLSLGI